MMLKAVLFFGALSGGLYSTLTHFKQNTDQLTNARHRFHAQNMTENFLTNIAAMEPAQLLLLHNNTNSFVSNTCANFSNMYLTLPEVWSNWPVDLCQGMSFIQEIRYQLSPKRLNTSFSLDAYSGPMPSFFIPTDSFEDFFGLVVEVRYQLANGSSQWIKMEQNINE
jgi:hypothetical protein